MKIFKYYLSFDDYETEVTLIFSIILNRATFDAVLQYKEIREEYNYEFKCEENKSAQQTILKFLNDDKHFLKSQLEGKKFDNLDFLIDKALPAFKEIFEEEGEI